jgi:hypothetical protein
LPNSLKRVFLETPSYPSLWILLTHHLSSPGARKVEKQGLLAEHVAFLMVKNQGRIVLGKATGRP